VSVEDQLARIERMLERQTGEITGLKREVRKLAAEIGTEPTFESPVSFTVTPSN
jgi:hypothetical protein